MDVWQLRGPGSDKGTGWKGSDLLALSWDGVPELPAEAGDICHQKCFLGTPKVGQVAHFDVFLLSTCQGCGLAESWTVGRRGWGVFALCQCHWWQKGHVLCPAAGGSSVWRSHVVYAALSGYRRCGALCSPSFPNTIQLSGLFWKRRNFPSSSTVSLGACRGAGRGGVSLGGVSLARPWLSCASPSSSQLIP